MRGEKVAVQRLSPAGKNNVTPLFVLAPKQYVGKKATKNHPAIPAPNVFAQDIMTVWGTSPFFLDASALPVAGGQHPILGIAEACRAIGLQMIPATPLIAPAYQQVVQAIFGVDGRGIGLRVDLNEFSSAAQWLGTLPLPLGEVDLIVDVADSAPMLMGIGPAVVNVFQGVPNPQHWRSITVAGTSMPENFAGMVAGVHTIPRAEVTLWQNLAAAQLPYQIHFGDYATIPTVPAPSGIAWGFPINVRYTLAHDFLICRGVRTTGFGAVDAGVQLTGHAQSVVAYPNRHAVAHFWADVEINNIANGAPPQLLEHWVRLGVNRHIELVRNLLP